MWSSSSEDNSDSDKSLLLDSVSGYTPCSDNASENWGSSISTSSSLSRVSCSAIMFYIEVMVLMLVSRSSVEYKIDNINFRDSRLWQHCGRVKCKSQTFGNVVIKKIPICFDLQWATVPKCESHHLLNQALTEAQHFQRLSLLFPLGSRGWS